MDFPWFKMAAVYERRLQAVERILAGLVRAGASRWHVAATAAALLRGLDGEGAGQVPPEVAEEVMARERLSRPVLVERALAGTEGRPAALDGSTRARRNLGQHALFGEPELLLQAATAPQSAQRGGRRRRAAAAGQAGKNMEEHPEGNETVDSEVIVQREEVKPDAEKPQETEQDEAQRTVQEAKRKKLARHPSEPEREPGWQPGHGGDGDFKECEDVKDCESVAGAPPPAARAAPAPGGGGGEGRGRGK